jgi:predicted DNA-binding transcriptional regulator YafY
VWDHHFRSASRYRIERIIPESLTVLPGVLPATERHVRRRELRFRLTPERARYGVTERFPEQRAEVQEDGSIIVTAQMPDQFTALHTLLRYGDGVECLAPEEMRAELGRIGAALVQQYGHGPRTPELESMR